MGFWKRNWEKITSDTISGLMIRLMAGIILLILGLMVVPKVVSLPVDNEITKELIDLVYKILFFIYCILLFFLPTILNWLSGRRESKNKEWELKNENLKLENENLKLQLELRQQEQQSPPDQEE